MNIALIGFRGTGKSTIGKKLAKRLSMEFVDLDKQISKRASMSVSEIFAKKGEAKFRELESKIVEEFCAKDNFCIACGGGVILDTQNVENLKGSAKIVLLQSDAKTIYKRIKNDQNRPALTQKGKFEEIVELLEKRKSLYENAADIKLDTSTDTAEETVQKIIDELNTRGFL